MNQSNDNSTSPDDRKSRWIELAMKHASDGTRIVTDSGISLKQCVLTAMHSVIEKMVSLSEELTERGLDEVQMRVARMASDFSRDVSIATHWTDEEKSLMCELVCVGHLVSQIRLAEALSEMGKPESESQVGPTGEYPDGKISEDDGGELRIAVSLDRERGLVNMDFGTMIKWFSMSPLDAVGLSQALVEASKALVMEEDND